jgi:hypothetical protein
MARSVGFKLLSVLGLCAALTLSACGGGGGDSGTPLVPPTSKFIMTPNITTVTLADGGWAEPVRISGGQPPYYVGSSTPYIIPKLLDDGTLYLQATAGALGVCSGSSSGSTSSSSSSSTCSVWIQDSSYSQTTLQIGISITSAPTVDELWSSLGINNTATVDVTPGTSQSFTVFNGTAPYMATNSNNSIATITSNGVSSFTISGGQTTGTSTIVVIDANGRTLTLTVNNASESGSGSGSTPPQAMAVTPASVTGVVGNTVPLIVSGGTPPYTVTSYSPTVATASINGSVVSVNLLAAGNATLVISDAAGDTPVMAQVTVTSSTNTGSLTTSPTSGSGVVGNTLIFSVIGGKAPYTAVSSNQGVATASVNGSTVSVQLLTAGNATITIQDSQNAMTTASVSGTAPSTGNQFTVIPPSQTLTEGSTSALTFMLANFTGPFYITLPAAASSLITVNPMLIPAPTDKTQPVTFTVTGVSGACVTQNISIPITVTDSANNTSSTVNVVVQDTNTANDGTAGCVSSVN